MPKQGTLVITIDGGDLTSLNDALPFNDGITVNKRSESEYLKIEWFLTFYS
jgi:hypothetical protein